MIEITAHSEGAILPIRAQPGARRNEVRGEQDGMLKVSVTQAAEKGKANKALIELVAKTLGVKRSQIELISGPTAAHKRLLIRGVGVEELQARLAALE